MRRQRRRSSGREPERILESIEMPDESPLSEDPLVISTPIEESSETPESPPLSRVTVRRRLPAIRPNWPLIVTMVALIALTAFFTASNRGTLPRAVQLWWPLAIVVMAVIWLLRSLIRRGASSLLASTALLGFGISLLLASAYQVPLNATLLGVPLIAAGMGIIVRGLFWRSGSAKVTAR